MSTQTKTQNTLITRLRGGGYEENLRFIKVLEILRPNDDIKLNQMTRVLSNLTGSSVGTFNNLISEHKPTKMTISQVNKLKAQIDYRLKGRSPKVEFNIDYIMYGKDPKTGKSIKPFTRELESSDKELFKPKKSQGKEGINTDMCYRVKAVRTKLEDTQGSFAEKLGVERYVISSIEGCRQNPTIDFIKLLRKNFSIDPWWVMEGEGEMIVSYDKGDQAELYKLREKVDQLEQLNTQNQRVISGLLDESEKR